MTDREGSGSRIREEEKSKTTTTIPNGDVLHNGQNPLNGEMKTGDSGTSSSTSSTQSLSDTKCSIYSSMLSNDDIVIVDTTPPVTIHRKAKITSSGNSNRAGATIRGLPDEELPQMDTVRRAKDVFETLAKKQRETAEKNGKRTNIGRSKSMLVLTGRAWCNGAHRLSGHHYNGVCNTATNGTRSVVPGSGGGDRASRPNLGRSNTLPPQQRFQRSCSNLDKYFQDSSSYSSISGSDDEGVSRQEEWERYDRNNSGSPISPEVIRKIREQGTCVTFFGGHSHVEDIPESDNDDDYSDSGLGGTGSAYLMDYDFYRSPNSTSPSPNDNHLMTASLDRRKPKIVSFLPKSPASGGSPDPSSPPLSSDGGSENPSPAPPPLTDKGFTSSWLLTMEELKSTFNHSTEDGAADVTSLRSTSSYGSGCIRLKHRYGDLQNGNGCLSGLSQTNYHGKWLKNPYWNGSYYVVYDFTNRAEDLESKANLI